MMISWRYRGMDAKGMQNRSQCYKVTVIFSDHHLLQKKLRRKSPRNTKKVMIMVREDEEKISV